MFRPPAAASARRVVVTGIGAVSPNGIGREEFWRNSLAGVSGVGRITHFDPEPFTVRIAGEVSDFSESDWLETKERPHVGRVTPLSRAAAAEGRSVAGSGTESLAR